MNVLMKILAIAKDIHPAGSILFNMINSWRKGETVSPEDQQKMIIIIQEEEKEFDEHTNEALQALGFESLEEYEDSKEG